MLQDTSSSSSSYEPPLSVFCQADGDNYKCEKMVFDDQSVTPADAEVGDSVWPSFCQKHATESAKDDSTTVYYCQKPQLTDSGSVVLPYGV